MIVVPEELKQLAELFKKNDFKLYIVGGYVRDSYLGIKNNYNQGIDLCSTATPDEVDDMLFGSNFKINILDRKNGYLTIFEKSVYSYSTFKKEVYSLSNPDVKNVDFVKNIEDDAESRDFRIDAIYYDILENEYVDPLGGIEDLKNKIIRTVKPAKLILTFDSERILRLIRLACSLGFEIGENEKAVAKTNAEKVQLLGRGKIRREFDKMIHAEKIYPELKVKDAHYRALKMLEEYNILKYILPDIDEIRVKKVKDYDGKSLYGHILDHYKKSPENLRLASLFFDMVNKKKMESKVDHFEWIKDNFDKLLKKLNIKKRTGNRKKSIDIIEITNKIVNENIGEEGLNYDAENIRRVKSTIVGYYFYKTAFVSQKQLRRFIFDNYSAIDDIIEIKRTFNTTAKEREKKIKTIEALRTTYKTMKNEKVVFEYSELNIGGEVLIHEFPKVKLEKLSELMNDIAGSMSETTCQNDEETIIKYAHKVISAKRDYYLEK